MCLLKLKGSSNFCAPNSQRCVPFRRHTSSCPPATKEKSCVDSGVWSCSGMGTQLNFGFLVSHCAALLRDLPTTEAHKAFLLGLAVVSQRYPPTHGHTHGSDALTPPIFFDRSILHRTAPLSPPLSSCIWPSMHTHDAASRSPSHSCTQRCRRRPRLPLAAPHACTMRKQLRKCRECSALLLKAKSEDGLC